MKSSILLALSLGAGFSLVAVSCGRKQAQVDATQALQQSFQAAQPEVRQAIQVVNTHLQSKDYTAAARALAPVVLEQQLTEPEKQAVGVALEQISRAIAADQSLNTKEMYELRAKMFQAINHSGSHF